MIDDIGISYQSSSTSVDCYQECWLSSMMTNDDDWWGLMTIDDN